MDRPRRHKTAHQIHLSTGEIGGPITGPLQATVCASPVGASRTNGGFISDKRQIKMQLPLQLVTFEYQHRIKIRTVTIDGDPWFYAKDVCDALAIGNPSQAIVRLDKDDLSSTEGVDTLNRRQKFTIVNESGLYALVFESRTEESQRFKRWVTKEVLPQIRKTGGFGRVQTHAFVRRFNDNWDRVDTGYFGVFGEIYVRLFGKLEQLGHLLAEKAPDGKTHLRPDVSVGQTFPKFLKEKYPQFAALFKMYRHRLPDGYECEARQYENQVLPAFIEFLETVWLRHYAEDYLRTRDPVALEYLPKMLPAPDTKKQSQYDVGRSKMRQMVQNLEKQTAK